MFLLPRYSLATVEDSQCGVSGYNVARGDLASGGRNTLQRIPEETAGEAGGGVGGHLVGWTRTQPTWPELKEKTKNEVLIRPGELSSNKEGELNPRPEEKVKSDERTSSDCEFDEQVEASLGLILKSLSFLFPKLSSSLQQASHDLEK